MGHLTLAAAARKRSQLSSAGGACCPGTRTCLNRAARAARPEQTGPTTMSTQRSYHRSRHWLATRQAGARLGRRAMAGRGHHRPAAGLGRRHGRVREPGPDRDGARVPITPVRPATVRVIRVGGMAGWQAALIAAGGTLAAAPPPCSRTASWPAAAAPPLPPPDAPTRNRTPPRLSDHRPPGAWTVRQACVCPQADPASHDDRRAARALTFSLFTTRCLSRAIPDAPPSS